MIFASAATYITKLPKKMALLAQTQSSLVKHFFIYATGNLLLRSISLVLTPITLTMLSPADYGLLALVTSFTNVMVVFLGFGLRQVFALEFFHHDAEGRKRILNHIIALYLVISGPIFLCMIVFRSSLNHYLFLDQAPPSLLYICYFFCFIYFFTELFYQVLQYQQKAWLLTALQVFIALFTIVFNVCMLCIFHLGVTGLMFGYCIGMSMVCAIGSYYYLRYRCYTSLTFPKNSWKYLQAGFPFIPTVLFGWLLASGNRWLLARYSSLEQVGMYALADTASIFFTMLILQPLAGSYLPYLFKQFAEYKDNLHVVEQWNRKVMWLCMSSMTIIITIGYIIGKPLLYWLLPLKFHAAVGYVWPILLGNVFLMGTYFSLGIIQFYKKTYFLAASLALPAVLNMILGYVLIPYYGVYGCVLGTAFSYAAYFGITLWYNARMLC